MSPRHRWSRLRESESGTSLTEMLITMLIVGLVLSATVTLVIGLERSNAQNVARTDQIDEARVAVERLSKALRTSVMQSQLGCSGCTEDAFIQGEEYRVQFYANIDNPGNTVGPSKVTFRVDPTGPGVGELHQTTQVPDSNVPSPTYGYQYTNTANIRDSVLARGILTSTGAPIFSYYDGSGAALVPTSGALTSLQLKSVLSIEVLVTAQDSLERAEPTTVVQRMMLPNAAAVIRQGEEESP